MYFPYKEPDVTAATRGETQAVVVEDFHIFHILLLWLLDPWLRGLSNVALISLRDNFISEIDQILAVLDLQNSTFFSTCVLFISQRMPGQVATYYS